MASPSSPKISRATIVRGVLAVLSGGGALIAGLVLAHWPIALGLFVVAVVVAPRSWINVDLSEGGSAGPGAGSM